MPEPPAGASVTGADADFLFQSTPPPRRGSEVNHDTGEQRPKYTLNIDLAKLNGLSYISPNGKAVAYDSDLGVAAALAHELVHTIIAIGDETAPTHFAGPTVTYTNLIHNELGIDERVSYPGSGDASEGIVAGTDYTNGHRIDTAIVMARFNEDYHGIYDVTEKGHIAYSYDLLIGKNDVGDTLSSAEGDDYLYGFSGDDSLDSGSENDEVFGGTGNDTIVAGHGGGDDHYDGGDDVDTITFTSTTQGVNINLTAGTASGTETNSDTLVAIENVVGGSGNDTITGSTSDNILEGGSGNDTLSGGSSADVYAFSTASGHDVITDSDGLGSVIIDGVTLSGQAEYHSSGQWDLGGQRLTQAGSSLLISTLDNNTKSIEVKNFPSDYSEFLGISLENPTADDDGSGNSVPGGNGNPVSTDNAVSLTGGSGNDFLVGGDNWDTLDGGAGNNVLVGGAGGDSLRVSLAPGASGGNNIFFGGDGNDGMGGHTGNDLFYGGRGNDSIGVIGGNDTVYAEEGNDLINIGFISGSFLVYAGDGADTINTSSNSELTVYGEAGADSIDARALSVGCSPLALVR